MINYKVGQLLGDYGLKFVERTNPHIAPSGGKYEKALFECYCKEKTPFEAMIAHVKNGATKSCGCRIYATNKKSTPIKELLYYVWNNMKRRCYTTTHRDYHNWGGRGVTICQEWLESFETFYDWALTNGYKRGLVLDKDGANVTGKIYCPENCSFITIAKSNGRKREGKKMSNCNNKYKGINWHKRDKKWAARIAVNGKRISLGYFVCEIEAVKARDAYIIKNGLTHRLNFPKA